MRQNFDFWVCRPEVGINQQRDMMFLQFELMNCETLEGTGEAHSVMMTVPDAMRLLQTLQYVQRRFSLPEISDDLSMIEIPCKGN